MSDAGYVYDQAWEQERERLAGIEALWDPGTRAILSRHVAAGSRVLEAGAGGGSIVSWLASEVGPSGHVLAIDLDTRFVEPLASDVVEVRKADLVADDLPTGEYGRRLPAALAEAGLTEVTGEGRSLIIDGSHPGFAFFSLSFEQLAPAAMDAGLMNRDDAEDVGARMRGGTERIITPTLMAATGRR